MLQGGMEELCLTLHQPWASLVLLGIKRIEGRNWPTKHRGRLWIHAASKTPEGVEAVEGLYRDIYSAEGIADLKFPEHYPTSVLVGCIDVVGCLSREELSQVKSIPDSVKLELMSEYGFLCENAQLLTAPVKMRGWQGIFHLDPSVTKRAVRNLQTSPSPRPIRFTDHVPSETLQRARSSSRGRGYQSRGKENDGFGSGLSTQFDSREGGTNWEAVLPPRALAARAALAASMGRGRPFQAKEDRWQGTEAVRGRLRARSGDGALSWAVLPSEENGFRVGPSGGVRAAVGVQQGREGKRAGGREGGRDGSEKYPRGPELESASAVQSCEEERLGMGRAEEKQARDATEILRSWTRVGTSEEGGTKMDSPGNKAELDSRVQNGNRIGSKPPPQAESSTPLDADAWPDLGGRREASSEGLMSPRSVLRKRRSEALVEGSCGATPWLERVRIGKGPKLTEPESEQGVDRQAFVLRQLRKKSAMISDQLR